MSSSERPPVQGDGALYRAACSYLGCRTAPSEEMLAMVGGGLEEARRISRFRAVGKVFSEPLPFLRQEPYLSFLAGCTGYALVAMTLGIEIERRIRTLFVTDPVRAVVLDACASALIEQEGDAWEERFGTPRTFRFCPGYGGSSAEDIRPIFEALSPERIGMQIVGAGLMAPQKSMAGIVGIGKEARRTCGACMLRGSCVYLKEGTRCYRSENN